MITAKENPDPHFMARALELAERGRYSSHPNPRVGCVIVKDGVVVGEGWHRRIGEAHAEVLALEQAGHNARGATVYVTLEPCCHQGRTPACTSALIQAGVARVACAMEDPNPRVAGHGLRALQDAGIKTSSGELNTDATALNAGFVSRMSRGRPLVRLKLAMSLDGRTAMASGESRWITGGAARLDVHRQRAQAGAVMVGAGTVIADDPRLTVRLEGEWRQPERVILDSRARTPASARVFRQAGRTLLLTADEQSRQAKQLGERGAEIIGVPLAGDRLDLGAALAALAECEVNTVLVEAGANLAGALMQARLVDELLLYVAPDLLGHEARALMQLPGLEQLSERVRLQYLDVCRIGEDLRLLLAAVDTV